MGNFDYGNFDIEKFNFKNGKFEFNFDKKTAKRGCGVVGWGCVWGVGVTADDDRGCYDPV